MILAPNGTGSVLIDGTLEPNADSSYTLGASGNEWSQAYIDTVTATNVAGTLTTAAQTNITSVGTLDGITIAGSQTVQMGTNRVQGVTDPVSAQDAATKNYVDGLLSSGTTIFTLQADSGSNDTVETGDTIDFEGTANEIETAVSANKVVIGLPSNVTIGNNLTVGGDLTVTGITTTVSSTNLSIADQYIYLNTGNAIGAANTTFAGSGLDDATLVGYFEGTTTTTYYVRIDATGTPDTFEWSKDNFATTEATGVSITAGEIALDNNIKVEFLATTGHTLNDVWSGTANPVAQDAGFWANENNGTGKYGYTHVGIYYDQSDRTWKAVSNYTPEPVGNINIGAAGFEYAKFEAGEFISGSLVISGTEIKTTVSNESLELAANGTGVIDLQSSTDVTGDITLKAQSDLRFADADSSNWVAFQAPATVSSNITWTLPNADAAVNGYALVSNAAGTLSWAAAGATVSQDETTNTNFNLYFASTTSGALTAVKYDTGVHYNPSTGIITTGELTLGASNPTVLASNGILKLKSSGTNNLYLGNASEQEAALVIEPTASGVNYGAVRGAASAANSVVQFGVDGSDTNISLGLSTKGTGNVMVGSGSLTSANPSRKLQVNPDSASKIAIGVQASGTTSTQKALIDFIASNGTGLTVMGQGASTSEEFRFDTVTGYEFATGSATHASGTVRMSINNTGTVTATTFSGALSGNATTATTATNVTATANNATNETVYVTFVDGTTGAQGIETDTNLTYNPSTNTLTTSIFSGTATNAQYADLAERYLPDAEYPFGTVMTVGGGAEVTYCTQDSIPVGVDKYCTSLSNEQ